MCVTSYYVFGFARSSAVVYCKFNACVRLQHGDAALHVAATKGHLQAIEALVEGGAEVNAAGQVRGAIAHCYVMYVTHVI